MKKQDEADTLERQRQIKMRIKAHNQLRRENRKELTESRRQAYEGQIQKSRGMRIN